MKSEDVKKEFTRQIDLLNHLVETVDPIFLDQIQTTWYEQLFKEFEQTELGPDIGYCLTQLIPDLAERLHKEDKTAGRTSGGPIGAASIVEYSSIEKKANKIMSKFNTDKAFREKYKTHNLKNAPTIKALSKVSTLYKELKQLSIKENKVELIDTARRRGQMIMEVLIDFPEIKNGVVESIKNDQENFVIDIEQWMNPSHNNSELVANWKEAKFEFCQQLTSAHDKDENNKQQRSKSKNGKNDIVQLTLIQKRLVESYEDEIGGIDSIKKMPIIKRAAFIYLLKERVPLLFADTKAGKINISAMKAFDKLRYNPVKVKKISNQLDNTDRLKQERLKHISEFRRTFKSKSQYNL